MDKFQLLVSHLLHNPSLKESHYRGSLVRNKSFSFLIPKCIFITKFSLNTNIWKTPLSNCIRTINVDITVLYILMLIQNKLVELFILKKQHFEGILLNMSVVYLLNKTRST